MIDFIILSHSTVSFILFVILHLIIFRRINKNKVFFYLTVTYLGGLLISILIWIYYYRNLSYLLYFIPSVILYTLLSMIYVLGVYGIMESSIRLKLLLQILAVGKRGLSHIEILKKYNSEIIVKKRLARFIASGEVDYQQGFYQVRRKLTLFLIPALIFHFFWKIYRSE